VSGLIAVDPAGWLSFGPLRYRCALGKGGVRSDKREGDGATPIGRFALRELFYRPDKLATPACLLSKSALKPEDGWCDDPGHPDYNRLVRLPHAARCETMWRGDDCYDLVVPLGYNDDPPVADLGSAIFLHVAKPGYSPTEGCVALAKSDLLTLLATLPAGVEIAIA
jgi:L,D-peptidoglycan transpeptidase YkuD (ErfK/YbiS/YcfS/YnhG family)